MIAMRERDGLIIWLAFYIAAGLTAKQVAQGMHLQPNSIKKNRQRLRQRMGYRRMSHWKTACGSCWPRGMKKGARSVELRAPVFRVGYGLDDALCEHGVGNLHEAGDVGALHVVDVAIGLGAELDAVFVDVGHDGVQTVVHFLGAPL